MIPVVEDYLSELLDSKLSYLRDNPSQYPVVLGVSPTRIKALTNFLAKTPIKIIKGYPREPAQLPCVCILLSSEEESQEALGNIDEYFEDRGTHETKVFIEKESHLLKVTATGAVFAELANPADIITAVSYKDRHGNLINLVEGEFYIHSNFPYQVQICKAGLCEGDEIFVTYYYRGIRDTQYTRYLFEANYRIESWANNGDLVVDMYHLVKWALLSGRDYLGKERHLFQQKVTGADFQPAPNFFPEFVYRRALSFWCQFSTLAIDGEPNYTEGDQIIEKIEVDATLYDAYEGGGRNGGRKESN